MANRDDDSIEQEMIRLLIQNSFMVPGKTGNSFAALGGRIEAPKGSPGDYVFNNASSKPSHKNSKFRGAVEDFIRESDEQSFDDIVGNEEALQQLKSAIEAPVKHKELYESYGLKFPTGVLLSGPPGCGKTMFARAASNTMKELYGKETEYLSMSGTELQSSYVGRTEQRIHAMFSYAKDYKKSTGHPLLIFIDEAEVILPDRTGNSYSYEKSQVAAFLAEMDGMQEAGAFIILATNRPEAIDQALLRDGRCDMKIVIEAPNKDSVTEILKRRFTDYPHHESTSITSLIITAVESLYDPYRVIMSAQGVGLVDGEVQPIKGKNFCLEHILSGAMVSSIPERAARIAFERDKMSLSLSGIHPDDVIEAVDTLFKENVNLNHEFAFKIFSEQFREEIEADENHQGRLH